MPIFNTVYGGTGWWLERPTITWFTYDSKNWNYTWNTYWDANCITFNPDGTKVYLVGESKNTVFQFSLGTAWDITTATYDNKSKATGLNVSNSAIFSDDGLTMWIGGWWNTGYVYKYTLSTAWDVSTASYVWDTTWKSNVSFFECTWYWIANDWQYLFMLSRWSKYIRRYTMTTPYDITTLQGNSGQYQEYSISVEAHKVFLNPQWTQLFYYGRQEKKIHICALSTPFDLTTISETSQWSVTNPSNTTNITAVTIDNNWSKMYLWWYNIGWIYQYTTTTS